MLGVMAVIGMRARPYIETVIGMLAWSDWYGARWR